MSGFLEYMIYNKTLVPKLSVDNWKDAILKGGDILIHKGVIERRYLTTMIEKVEEMGPYFNLAPGIAMPHGRPEEGVLKTGYLIVTLDRPINFGDKENDPIWLMIFFAANDPKEHSDVAIPQIADFCDNEEMLERLKTCQTVDEMEKLVGELV